MRVTILAALSIVGAAAPVGAMTHPATPAPGFSGRAAAADPDEGLERLAAAGTRGDQSRAKPAKSVRGILKDDPYLRSAFAYLDNK